MFTVLNDIAFGLHCIILCLSVLVLLGNFFKKKSVLTNLGLYGEHVVLSSFLCGFAMTVFIAFDGVYGVYDRNQIGPSFGLMLTVCLLLLGILCGLCLLLYKWYKMIPET